MGIACAWHKNVDLKAIAANFLDKIALGGDGNRNR
jgi:hypothetical protein